MLRMKVASDLGELVTFKACREPENQMFSVTLKNDVKIVVFRCDEVNLMVIDDAHKFPASLFEKSAEKVPGATWYQVKVARRGFRDADGKFVPIEGRAHISDSYTKEGWRHHYECYNMTFPTCERTFAVLELLAKA